MKKCKFGSYDETDKQSIYKYALLLLDKNLSGLYSDELKSISTEYFATKGKGKLGDLVESLHFGIENNRRPEPDFPQAPLELKTTPLKIVRNCYVAKERLSLSMIDYHKIEQEVFESSSFLTKNASLLLLFYLYEKGKLTEQIFKKIKLWEIPEDDLAIIKKDWEKINQKVKWGKAEEISGGDTFYLEAFRKGAGGTKDLTSQPNSKIPVNRRALGFKQKYLNLILNGKDENLQGFLPDNFAKINISFEDYVIEKFKPFIGKSLSEISENFGLTYSEIKKDLAAVIAKAILGVKIKNEITEFEKADILMKTIVQNENGTLKESMSFKNINYEEIEREEWNDSYFFNQVVNRKFFFVIFEKGKDGMKRLKRVMFWNMPNEMALEAEIFWEDTKEKVRDKKFDQFWKLIQHRDFHVRPKGTKESRYVILADGTKAPKLAYWINSETIKKAIKIW